MKRLEKAREELESSSTEHVDRNQIVAFAYLSAFCDHYPDLKLETDVLLLEKWKPILNMEYDRFVKQRRIALAEITLALSS